MGATLTHPAARGTLVGMTDVQGQDLGEQEFDPFAAFDESMGVGQVADIHPTFHEMRAECPVHTGRFHDRFGLELPMEAALVGDKPSFAMLSFETVQQVLRDGQTFSSSGYAESMGLVMGHSILEMDEPEHNRYRQLIQQAFTRKAMETWEVELVQPVVHGLVDRIVDRSADGSAAGVGHAELVRELLFPFPVHVIAGMLGLPREGLAEFHGKAVELISIATDIERGLTASQWLYDYFAAIIAERRAEPKGDVISVLVQAELDGQRLTDDEIIAFLRLLLPAGAETTYRSSSNLMFGLLSHPDQLAALRDDRSLMQQAIEEGLRWEPPLTGIGRTAMVDTEVAGVAIPAGAAISVEMGSANRDPERWDDPDRFDIHRPMQPHMAFASGPHTCLGMHLARMETTVAINAILDRLPGVRFDDSVERPQITGLMFRAPTALPVVFDV
jgi:cytochrome P450